MALRDEYETDAWSPAPPAPVQQPQPVAPAPDVDASGQIVESLAGGRQFSVQGQQFTPANYGPDVQGGNLISAAYGSPPTVNPAPVVAASATRPRDASVRTDTTTPISDAAAKAEDIVGSASMGGKSKSYTAADLAGYGGPSAPQQAVDYKSELAVRQAREDQGVRDSTVEMQRASNAAAAGLDAERAKREAYVASYRAVNGADAVLRGGTKQQREGLIADAAAKNAAAGLATGVATAARQPLPAVDELNRLQQGQNVIATAARSASEGELAKGAAADRQASAEVKQRINGLGAQLLSAKDPKARETISRNILTLLGKDEPNRFKVIHAPGGETLSPDGLTKIKGPDAIVVIDERTGTREIIKMDSGPAAGAAPPPNHVAALKANPKLAEKFDAKYGKGASQQYLGN